MRASMLILVVKYDYAFAPVKEELRAFHICHARTVDGPECTLMQRLYMSSTDLVCLPQFR